MKKMMKNVKKRQLKVVAAAVLTMSVLLQGCAGKTENVATGQTAAEVSAQEAEAGGESAAGNEAGGEAEAGNEAGREAEAENETETGNEVVTGKENVAEGITFTDDLGRTVTVKSHERVVTMIGSFTDIWLLAGGDIVATANDSWTSFDFGLGDDVINIGSHVEPDAEKVIAAKPDLIIASANTDADVNMEKLFADAGITTAYFAVSDFEDYIRMLEICTDITGRKDLLQKNGYDVRNQVDAAKERAQKRIADGEKAPTVVFLRASTSSIKAKGSKDNVGGVMLANLGCINIADDDASLIDDLSMEAIIAADPDYIFVTTQGTDTEAVLANVEETLLNNPAWNKLTAVKNNQYYMLEKELYNLKPNARWGEAYEKLEAILYGESSD